MYLTFEPAETYLRRRHQPADDQRFGARARPARPPAARKSGKNPLAYEDVELRTTKSDNNEDSHAQEDR